MFEHLDDPRPPALGDGFRRRVVQRARRRRRHRRLVGGAGVALAAVVAGTAGLYARALWHTGDIDRVDVAGTGDPTTGEARTFLVAGLDRHGEATNPDTLVLARLDPAAGSAALLSVPRDLMVVPPGGGAQRPISMIGRDDLVAVVEGQVGVPVDHYVELTFDGFRSLVDRLGGVEVFVDRPVRDTGSGLWLDDLGCVALDGEEALALVRSRRAEVLDDSGTWVRDPHSDLRRVATQRQVLLAALAGLGGEAADPVTLQGHVDWAVDHLVVDDTLGTRDLYDLARAVAALDPSAVSQATVPVVVHPDDPNRLALDPDDASATIDAFAAGAPLPANGRDAVAGGPEAGGTVDAHVAPC